MSDSVPHFEIRRSPKSDPQPFPLAPGGMVGSPLRPYRFVRPMRPTTIERIFAERGHGPANDDHVEHHHRTAALFVYLTSAALVVIGIASLLA